MPLDNLLPTLIERTQALHYAAIIVDPIYKIITGDENNASEMGKFCNYFDAICVATGAAVIYCHHHSKGAQGSKRSIDRASGSGVFARDPDALLDMIQLSLPDDMTCAPHATAWRIEGTLREFAPLEPINIWFDWPLHYVDQSGKLNNLPTIGSQQDNLSKSKKRKNREHQLELLQRAFCTCSQNVYPVPIKMLCEEMSVCEKTIRRYIDQAKTFWCQNGLVGRIPEGQKQTT